MPTTDTPDYVASGVVNMAQGGFTGSGEAVVVTVGFKPNRVEVWNETDATLWVWLRGMAATKVLKQVTAGTTTADTGSAIVDNDNGTFTLSATLAANGKVLVWRAEG